MPSGPAPLTDVSEGRGNDIDSVRARRGFRPLSVITGAVDFSIDPFPAMEQAELMRLVEANKKKLSISRDAPRNSSSDTIVLVSKESPPDTAEPRKSDETISASPSSGETAPTVHSDATTLFNTPPPLLSDHPLNCEGEDSFKVRTSYPLMTTSTPTPLIKAFAKDMSLLSTKSAAFADDLCSKKSYRNLSGLFARSAPANQKVYSSDSPPVLSKSLSQIRTPDDSGATTPSSARAPIYSSHSSRAKRLRKISTIFKRDSGDLGSVAGSPISIQGPDSSLRKTGISKLSFAGKNKIGPSSVGISKEKKKQDVSGLVPHLTDEAEVRYLV